MPLYDNPPHTADFYSPASTADAGGGVGTSFTLVESAVPCFAPTLSASEQERFGQTQIVVQHALHFRASELPSGFTRGWKLVCNGVTLHVTGIKSHQAAGTIPALTEVAAENLI